jgi:hypothetical protein
VDGAGQNGRGVNDLEVAIEAVLILIGLLTVIGFLADGRSPWDNKP